MGIEERKEYFKEIAEKAEQKRAELETTYSQKEGKAVKIKLCILGGEDDEPCVAFFRTATTATKKVCIDLMYTSPTKAEDYYLKACLIKEESDKRILAQDCDDDVYYLGALNWCGEQIRTASVYQKKN